MIFHTHIKLLGQNKTLTLRCNDKTFAGTFEPRQELIVEPTPIALNLQALVPGIKLDEEKEEALAEYMKIKPGNIVIIEHKNKYRMAVVLATTKEMGVEMIQVADGKGRLLTPPVARRQVYGRVIEKRSNDTERSSGTAKQVGGQSGDDPKHAVTVDDSSGKGE